MHGSPQKWHLVERSTRVKTSVALQWCRVSVAIGRCQAYVVTSRGHVCTNAPFWDEPGIVTDGALVDEFIKAFTGQCKDPTAAEVTINSDSAMGRGVP